MNTFEAESSPGANCSVLEVSVRPSKPTQPEIAKVKWESARDGLMRSLKDVWGPNLKQEKTLHNIYER